MIGEKMNCIKEQLLAWLDGEADAAATQCTPPCGDCTAWMEAYSDLQRDLLEAIFRQRCPASQTLSDFYFGLLNVTEMEAVKLHLAECPYCPTELEMVEQFSAE